MVLRVGTTKYSLGQLQRVQADRRDQSLRVTPGQTFTDEETVTIRGNTPVGEYRVQAGADAGKAVSEDDEADNCLLSAGTILVTTLPDLRLSTVTLAGAPVVVTPGGTISVGTVVQNAGVGDAGASTITFALVNAAGTARSWMDRGGPVVAIGTSTSTQTPYGSVRHAIRDLHGRACIDGRAWWPEAFDAITARARPGR